MTPKLSTDKGKVASVNMCVGGATQVPKPVRLLLIWPFGFVWFSTNSYQDDLQWLRWVCQIGLTLTGKGCGICWHAWMMLLYTFSTTKSIHPPKEGRYSFYYCRKRRAERRGFISSIKIYSTSWERNTAVWFLGKVYQAIRLGLNGGSIICLFVEYNCCKTDP